MKIGIISMQRLINFGSWLQAYGLKSLLEEQGHHVEFIDVRLMDGTVMNATRFSDNASLLKKLARRIIKGKMFFSANETEIEKIPRNVAKAMEGNSQLRHPTVFSDDAAVFHEKMKEMSFAKALKCTYMYKLVKKEIRKQHVIAFVKKIIPQKNYRFCCNLIKTN